MKKIFNQAGTTLVWLALFGGLITGMIAMTVATPEQNRRLVDAATPLIHF